MTERMRLRVFLPFGILFFGLFCYASINLPAWGYYRGPYGDAITSLAVYQRHATDTVNAINYDYRGFDTLGEEFILFTAVLGIMLLLRHEDDKHDTPAKPGNPPLKSVASKVQDLSPLSPTVQAIALPAVCLTVIFGFYIGLHGQLTPGGGFQAGVILAAAPLLIYLAQNTNAFESITSHPAMELVEALGAASYALIGVTPLLLGVPLLTNILPLGKTGDVFSAGNIALISACVGVEVTAAFLLVAYTYLQEIILGQVSEE